MHTQSTTKADKRAARRRNRNKRRRKLRQQRKHQLTGTQSNQSARQKLPIPKAKKSPEEISKSWETLCLETYERLTTWQSEAELNFWKARAEWLQNENKDLKEQLDVYAQNALSDENEKDGSASDDEEQDAAYLEFIAITKKHREDLRLKREKQNDAKGLD